MEDNSSFTFEKMKTLKERTSIGFFFCSFSFVLLCFVLLLLLFVCLFVDLFENAIAMDGLILLRFMLAAFVSVFCWFLLFLGGVVGSGNVERVSFFIFTWRLIESDFGPGPMIWSLRWRLERFQRTRSFLPCLVNNSIRPSSSDPIQRKRWHRL